VLLMWWKRCERIAVKKWESDFEIREVWSELLGRNLHCLWWGGLFLLIRMWWFFGGRRKMSEC
jgi:hypothetical protein